MVTTKIECDDEVQIRSATSDERDVCRPGIEGNDSEEGHSKEGGCRRLTGKPIVIAPVCVFHNNNPVGG